VWAWNTFGTSSYSNTACIFFPGPVKETSSFNVSLESGSLEDFSLGESSSFDIGLISGSLVETIIPISSSDDATASFVAGLLYGTLNPAPPYTEYFGTMSVALISGSLLTIVITSSAPPETASFESAFYSGSIIDVILSTSMAPETVSVDWGFYTGSIFETIITASMSMQEWSVEGGFYSGSVSTWVTTSYRRDTGSYNVGLISGSLQPA
jgi:hypothetical protein